MCELCVALRTILTVCTAPCVASQTSSCASTRVVLPQRPGSSKRTVRVLCLFCGARFMDAFKQSMYVGPKVLESLETRMTWTYNRAASAMLITSFTTMSAFVATAVRCRCAPVCWGSFLSSCGSDFSVGGGGVIRHLRIDGDLCRLHFSGVFALASCCVLPC